MILLDVDPNIVKPGWTPLFVVLLLAVALVFLYFSMRKQFRKIRIPDDAENTQRIPHLNTSRVRLAESGRLKDDRPQPPRFGNEPVPASACRQPRALVAMVG